jgi:hypothetical protein
MRSGEFPMRTTEHRRIAMITLELASGYNFQAFDIPDVGEFFVAGKDNEFMLALRGLTKAVNVHWSVTAGAERGKWYVLTVLPKDTADTRHGKPKLDYPRTIPHDAPVVLNVEIREGERLLHEASILLSNSQSFRDSARDYQKYVEADDHNPVGW